MHYSVLCMLEQVEDSICAAGGGVLKATWMSGFLSREGQVDAVEAPARGAGIRAGEQGLLEGRQPL